MGGGVQKSPFPLMSSAKILQHTDKLTFHSVGLTNKKYKI